MNYGSKVGKNKWYYVILRGEYQHMFKYTSETEEDIKLGNTHWNLCGKTPKNVKESTSFNKSSITFVKKLTEKKVLFLQNGVKFKELPKNNIYELWM